MTSPGIALGIAAAACAPQPVTLTISPTAQGGITQASQCFNCGNVCGMHADWCIANPATRCYPVAPGMGWQPPRPFIIQPLAPVAQASMSDADVDRIARRVVDLLDARTRVAER